MNQTATQTVRDRVVEAIVKRLKVDAARVTNESRLVEDLGADSLDLVELSMDLEDGFEFQMDDDKDLEDLKTVNDCVRYILARS